MSMSAFGNLWEHARLLSDASRNAQMIELLRRRAPGARVLEVGCGTGLLSCVAARMGARHVIAVEPTEIIEYAYELVRANHLEHIVEVRRGLVQDFAPDPVDLAFSELLNADPFAEGVLPAMDAAASWVAPGGMFSPQRLRVWAALVHVTSTAREVGQARAEVRALGAQHDLDVRGIMEDLAGMNCYRSVQSNLKPISDPVLVYDLRLGRGESPGTVERELVVHEAGAVGGVVIWFEADLDEGLVLGNPPDASGHWGQLCCAWVRERGVRAGEKVRIRVRTRPDGVVVDRLG